MELEYDFYELASSWLFLVLWEFDQETNTKREITEVKNRQIKI